MRKNKMNTHVGRPKTRPEDDSSIKFRIDKQTKKRFQIFCLENEITMQDTLENYIIQLMKQRKNH